MPSMTAPMREASPDDAQDRDGARMALARMRGKRLAIVVFIAFAVAFVASSAMQIVRAVFSRQAMPSSSTVPGKTADACTQGIASLFSALDRANATARADREFVSTLKADASLIVFRQGLRPEWDERDPIEKACASSTRGLESWASLLRFREALEEWIRREGMALEPVRRDVIAHLPAKLR